MPRTKFIPLSLTPSPPPAPPPPPPPLTPTATVQSTHVPKPSASHSSHQKQHLPDLRQRDEHGKLKNAKLKPKPRAPKAPKPIEKRTERDNKRIGFQRTKVDE